MLRLYSVLFRALICFFLLPASFAAALGEPTVLGPQNIAVIPVTFNGSDGNPIPMVPAVDCRNGHREALVRMASRAAWDAVRQAAAPVGRAAAPAR